MKYIEELDPGTCFSYKNNYYILTVDYKSNNNKLCYDLQSGHPRWLSGDTIIDTIQVYTMDEKNTIIPIKITEKIENRNENLR